MVFFKPHKLNHRLHNATSSPRWRLWFAGLRSRSPLQDSVLSFGASLYVLRGAISFPLWLGSATLVTRRGWLWLTLLIGITALPFDQLEAADNNSDRFRNFEIRVIRPKYFTKTKKFEIGVQAAAIINHTFIYTYMGHLNLTYHLNEALAFEAGYMYGLSFERGAKTTLKDKFKINTIIHRPQQIATGALIWTPFYGKFQTFSKNLTYFDFFTSLGGGITAIDHQFDHCLENRGSDQSNSLKPQLNTYPTMAIGAGQKIYLSKKTGVRWDVNYTPYLLKEGDGGCQSGESGSTDDSETSQEESRQDHVLVKIGISRFF